MSYTFAEWEEEDGTDGMVRAYPETAWHTMRDQSARTADDNAYVCVSDVADMLASIAEEAATVAAKARALVQEASALFAWDDPHAMGCHWTRDDIDDAGDKLQDILSEAENLPDVHVQWNGDAGTFYVTRASAWVTMTEADARSAGIDPRYL